MAIPKFEDFLYPFMMHLTDQDSNKSDMVSVLSDFFNLTKEDRNLKTKGGTTPQIYDRVGWSLQWLRRAKFVEIPERGIWRITQRGRDYMKNASDLRESDLLKYPEFAEYSGRKNERTKQHRSLSSSVSTILDAHKENWKEIVEALQSALKDYSPDILYFNSVISCLRLLGWRKSNGTISIKQSSNQDNDCYCVILRHEKDSHQISCLISKPDSGSEKNRPSLSLDSTNCNIGILWGNNIEIYYQESEEEKPTCVASIKVDSTDLKGEILCNLLEYQTFNYNKFTQYCKQLLKEVPNEVNLAKRLKEIMTDTGFIMSKIKEELLSEGFNDTLISDTLSQLSLNIKINTKGQQNLEKGNSDNVLRTRDNTMFSLDGGKTYLSKRHFVLATIKQYVKDHPNVTYDELESQFPSETHSKKRGVVRPLDIVEGWIKENADLKKRYFLSPKDIIQLNDGIRVVVNNQWGTFFPKFLRIAQSLYSVQSDKLYNGIECAAESRAEQESLHGIRISADSFSKFKTKK